MAQVCSGICERYKKNSISTKLSKSLPGNFRYGNGQKWCTLCGKFFITQQILCSCCKTRLRTKPRTKNRS